MTKTIRTNIIILSTIYFIFTACTKFNENEMIGVAKSLSTYERFEQDIKTGRVDSSVFIYNEDFGGLYVKIHYKTRTVEEGGDILVYSTAYASISKTNANGVLQWNTTWGDGVQAISGLTISENGNIHFIGHEYFEEDRLRYYYVILDEEGNFVLEKDLSTNSNWYIGGPYITKDGGVIITGCDDEFTNEARTEWESYWTIQKINSNGEAEWFKRNGIEGMFEYPKCAIETEDNGILVGIWKESANGTDLKRLEIYRTDLYGNVENQTVIYDANLAVCDIIKANDGGYLLATLAATLADGFYNWEKIVITKLNSNGDILWQKSHPVGSGKVIYQGIEQLLDYGIRSYADFRICKLMNSAYFVVDQRASDPETISIYKFNNSGELIE